MVGLVGLLAQQNPSAEFGVGDAVVGLIGIAVSLAIAAGICWLLYKAQQAIPAEHRRMEPGQIWLMMIPLFNLVWFFFVFPRVADSYASYFRSIGRPDVGDAGRGIGLAYAICAVCSVIPCLGVLSGLAALVLLIIYLVKIYGLKGQIGKGSGAFPVNQPTPPPAAGV